MDGFCLLAWKIEKTDVMIQQWEYKRKSQFGEENDFELRHSGMSTCGTAVWLKLLEAESDA